jgi:SulP family sulfate permease
MHRLRSTMMGEAEPPLTSSKKTTRLTNFLGQVPAVALIGMFHLMIGIPFGVSYFPVSWSPLLEEASDDGGPFPLPGKEALGIRMFLFSTIVGQIVFTIFSDFPNPIGLQMVENVPFCHELANIVIAHQGYGIDALSTLIVMFGLASVVVGIVFFLLGKFQLGRVVYFFPTHVSFTQPCRQRNIQSLQGF